MKTEDLNRMLNTFRQATETHSEDLFRARVMRRNNPGDLATQWASMRGVRLEHLAGPESWLSKLAEGGGGHFSLLVAHERKPGETLGELIVHIPGPETKPQRSAMARTDWDGPSLADFLAGEQSPTSAVPRPVVATPANPFLAAPTGTSLAAQRLGEAAVEAENRQLREQLERSRREVELEKLERKHKEDLEVLRREFVAQQPKQQEGPNLIQLIMEQGKQNAEMMRDLAKQQREDQARSEERMLKMLETLNKKPERSPLEDKLLSNAIDSDGRHLKQLEGVTQITNALTQSAMTLMTHQVEMMRQMAPEDEGPVMRLAEKIADAAIGSAKETSSTAKQLAENTQTASESAEAQEDAQEAFEAVEHSIKNMRPAHEVVPALLAALRGDPLASLMKKHKGDLSEVVKERFTAWVMEDPAKRLPYVKRELFAVEMALVAVGVVRPSQAYQQALAELTKQQSQAPAKPQPPPPPGAQGKATGKKPQPPPPFKAKRNGTTKEEPAPAEAQPAATEAPPTPEAVG